MSNTDKFRAAMAGTVSSRIEKAEALTAKAEKRTSRPESHLVETERLPEQPEPPKRTASPVSVKRDGISMTAADYDTLDKLRYRLTGPGVPVGKSETIRIALSAAMTLDDAALFAIRDSIPKIPLGPRTKRGTKRADKES